MTAGTDVRSRLFAPITVGAVPLPNRAVMAPMTRSRAGAPRVPNELMAEYYRQRASAGLIITEATHVAADGISYLGTPGIHTDEQVAGWRRITERVHAAGGRIFLQLWHVGRVSHRSLVPDGSAPVAPSAIAAEGQINTATGLAPFATPRALEVAEIDAIVKQFGRATARAREAGFDGVELHGANGYLIDQFLRDGSNRRTDSYGGTVDRRARFLLQVIDAAATAWSANRVGVRLSPTGAFNGMSDSNPAHTFSYVARALEPLDLAYLHIIDPVGQSGDAAADLAAVEMTPRMREQFTGPIIGNGGYGLETATRAIETGLVDLVSFGAPFIANPDLVARLSTGAPLNPPARDYFYSGGEKGYVDYPTL